MNSFDVEKYRKLAREKYEQNLTTDPDKQRRLDRRECKTCHYTISICGQAFTRYTCQQCDKEDLHHNTCVPTLCASCAVSSGLCISCGKSRND